MFDTGTYFLVLFVPRSVRVGYDHSVVFRFIRIIVNHFLCWRFVYDVNTSVRCVSNFLGLIKEFPFLSNLNNFSMIWPTSEDVNRNEKKNIQN